MEKLNDANISSIMPLVSPEVLKEEFPVNEALKDQIISYRKEVRNSPEK